MTTTSTDQTTFLCDASSEQWSRFESAACADGHASGKSAANDLSLWGDTVADAIKAVSEQQFRVAFVKNDGSWDVVETFTAPDADAANAYAEDNYAGQQWFVLNARGRNINGGDQE